MSKNYDLIATVEIDVNKPVAINATYGNLLIVGPAPSTPKVGVTIPDVGGYSSLQEVEDMGWQIQGDNPDPVGLAAKVAFSQKPKPRKVFIAPIKSEVIINNDDEEETVVEEPVETVKRAYDANANWYIVTLAGVSEEKYQAIAAYIENTDRMFFYTETQVFPVGAATQPNPIVTGNLFKTSGILGLTKNGQTVGTMPAENQYIAAAFATVLLNYKSGTETAAFKHLEAVETGDYSKQDIDVLKKANISYFVDVAGKTATLGGKTIGGEWIDVIRFKDWLQNDMQIRVVSVFLNNPKIRFNDEGITVIHNQMLASLKEGQNNGGIVDTEYDEAGNEIPAYETTVPYAAELSDADKASRSLSNFAFRAKIAGAIHFAEIKGSLSNTL